MNKYRVTVNRVVRDLQWRDVIVEAENEKQAEDAALWQANNEECFWDGVKTEALECEASPEIDDMPILVEDSSHIADRIDGYDRDDLGESPDY